MSPWVDTVATTTTRVLIEAVGAILARCSADEAAAIERQLAGLHSRAQRALGPRLDEIRDEALERIRAATPRRIHVELMTPAELAINAALQAVEAAGADVRLTQAGDALIRAQALVADVVDAPKAS